MTIDDGEGRMGRLMFFQQVPEAHERGVFGDRRAEGQHAPGHHALRD